MKIPSHSSEGDWLSAQSLEQQNPTENLKLIMSDDCDVCQDEELVQQVDSRITNPKKRLHIFCSPRFSI